LYTVLIVKKTKNTDSILYQTVKPGNTIRYDTIGAINVDWKAEFGQSAQSTTSNQKQKI